MKSKNIEDIYPLSPVQQGMVFHSLLAPASGVYVVQVSYEVHGYLNIVAFEQAWQQAVNRHPVLRTAFVWDNLDKPLQVVGQHVKLPLEQHDWRVLSPEKQQQQLEAFLQAERKRSFNLSKAPLMRLTLIQTGQDAYQFIWSYHHLLLDGWSVPLLLKEFLTLYKASCRGQNLYLEKPRPYRDYIAWLQQQDLSKAEGFWRQTLKGFTAPTPLRGDRMPDQRGSSQDQDYEEQQIQLSKEITVGLQSLAKKYQLTLNTLVQGAWAVLLSRYSGEDDVVFGATCSGRPVALAGAEYMVGLFVNTLPVRVKVNAEQPLLPWLQQLQAQQVELRQYEYSPLVEIHRMSDVPRDLPLFESLVVFENYPVEPSLQQSVENLDIRNVRTVERTNYPLTVFAAVPSELLLKISYDRHRFEPATITRMLGHFQTLLKDMAVNLIQCLWELPLLTVSERQQLLVEWNNTQSDYLKDQTILKLFEAQVERIPDAIAVVFEDEQVTYRELNRRTNQLAHYLQALGVGPEILVGICVERSLDMVVGLLGILKAGGAYVPFDPAYPQERLAFMLLDSQVCVLLTQQKLLATLPQHQAKVVCLDADWQEVAAFSDRHPTSLATPENLAYVIYTSGSTGLPKGVQILHGALVNFLSAMRQTPGLLSGDILLSVTTLSFDIAALELYLPLIVGAKLVLVSREVAADGTQLLERLTDCQATVMQATPATWQLLLAAGWQGTEQLKILCGGEALERRLANQLLLRGTEVWNLYGPTETTIWSAAHKVEPQKSAESQLGTVSIGRPIANTQFYILDSQQQPVPVGVVGELHIGGQGLARGYLNQSKLQADKFIPNPFNNQSGAQLYKTGDLARYLPDGTLEYIGRIDDQVKLRGFRIELGEISAVLNQHPGVQTSVVVVREDERRKAGGAGEAGEAGGAILYKRLVAYVVLNTGAEELLNSGAGESIHTNSINEQSPPAPPASPAPPALFVNQLRRFLEEKLPRYMIPMAFMILEALPLLPNGKVDRRSLPAPEGLRPKLEDAYVMPQTEVERAIATVWQKALNIEKIGIYDNFFDLGGHSLLMVRLHSQLREIFPPEISLVEMFRYPTISSLAEYFSHSKNEKLFGRIDSRNNQIDEGKKRLQQRREKRVSIVNDKKINKND